MRSKITKHSEDIPLVVDEGTIKKVNDNNFTHDYEFICPCCDKPMIISSDYLILDEYNESRWIGRCPINMVKIVLNRPD